MIALGRLVGIPVFVAVGISPVLTVVEDGWKRLEVGSHWVFVTVAVGNRLVNSGGFTLVEEVVGVAVVVGVTEMVVGANELLVDSSTLETVGRAVTGGIVVL